MHEVNGVPGTRPAFSVKIPYDAPMARERLSRRIEMELRTLDSGTRIVILCVGTDRSTGDALGPLVGTELARSGCPLFDVYGTLEDPVHAVNLEDTLKKIEKTVSDPFIIAVDASLGQLSSVGCIQFGSGPVRPGSGVNKKLPPVGDVHLTGIVNVGGFMEYFVLQNTRLSLVMNMAGVIAQSLLGAVKRSRGAVIPFASPDGLPSFPPE
ncbi:MAG TPA: spore protease YyaC [Paenibacillaceae bacterium]